MNGAWLKCHKVATSASSAKADLTCRCPLAAGFWPIREFTGWSDRPKSKGIAGPKLGQASGGDITSAETSRNVLTEGNCARSSNHSHFRRDMPYYPSCPGQPGAWHEEAEWKRDDIRIQKLRSCTWLKIWQFVAILFSRWAITGSQYFEAFPRRYIDFVAVKD
jgi:hypothetical protein